MEKLISCAFNMDTACVELRFSDGSICSIDTIAVENEIAANGETLLSVGGVAYLISCSRPRNNSELKKSSMVMPNPSQSFLMVETVALLLRPLMILLTVDWVTPLMLLSLLTEISCSRHSSKIRSLTASPMFMGITSLQGK